MVAQGSGAVLGAGQQGEQVTNGQVDQVLGTHLDTVHKAGVGMARVHGGGVRWCSSRGVPYDTPVTARGDVPVPDPHTVLGTVRRR